MIKKTLVCFFVLGLNSSVFAAGQETFATIPKTSTGNYITTIREAVNTNFATQHTMNTELYAADLLKANTSCFESSAAFNACFPLDWPTGFDVAADYTVTGAWDFTGATVTGISGGSMTWPAAAGITVYGGSSAWGTSLTLDTDLASVSSSDDSVASAKATKTALDAKASSTGIAFVASSLSDLKYDPDTEVEDDEYSIITNTGSVGDANDATIVPTLERAGSLFEPKNTSIGKIIANSSVALGTSAISSGECASVVSVTVNGVIAGEPIEWNPTTDITAVTGYAPVTTGWLTIRNYQTTNTINFKVCNGTSSAITPGAVTIGYKVIHEN